MLKLIFLTSSSAKMQYARYVFRNFDLTVEKFSQYGKRYVEPRIDDREQLLQESADNAIERLQRSGYFGRLAFIEDTSVIIHALSDGQKEVPGVDVKYWMRENSFESIDSALKKRGNDRSVVVRSDVLLLVPPKSTETEYTIQRFVSSTKGIICSREFHINPQPYYTWLDNKTFNKWFIPEGYDLPISMLNIEDADRADFRREAFIQMQQYLSKYYGVREKQAIEDAYSQQRIKRSYQLSFSKNSFVFLVSGPTCAGKSTLAHYLSQTKGFYHIEASDFMKVSYYEAHGVDSEVSIHDFAEVALHVNPAIVVAKIVEHLNEVEASNIIITGLRSHLEVIAFEKAYQKRSSENISVLYIEADVEQRFRRNLKRERQGYQKDFAEFVQVDTQQMGMGLERIQNSFSDKTILNNGTFEEFFSEFNDNFGTQILDVPANQTLSRKPLEYSILMCLLSLPNTKRYYSTTEINDQIENRKPELRNNLGRYFNNNFHPFFDIKIFAQVRKYRLSTTGYNYAMLLNTKEKNGR